MKAYYYNVMRETEGDIFYDVIDSLFGKDSDKLTLFMKYIIFKLDIYG